MHGHSEMEVVVLGQGERASFCTGHRWLVVGWIQPLSFSQMGPPHGRSGSVDWVRNPHGTERSIDVSTDLEIMFPNIRHSSGDCRIEIPNLLKVGLERSKVRVLQSPCFDGY